MYLDIHYMDAYKIFTWNKDRFPNPKGMIDQLKGMGFHLAVIVDPGIKVEKGYLPYEDGLKQQVFLTYPDSTPITAQVWPGWCHFPDFTNPKTRNWWGESFKDYVQTGVEGFWNDMNELGQLGKSFSRFSEI
jgi:alpha-glucosidase